METNPTGPARASAAVPPAPRATTLRAQRMANRIVRTLLRTPLLCRAIGARLMTVQFVGRKSGKRYTLPVAYTRTGDCLLVGTPFAWGRNLRTGEPVAVRLKGKRHQADVTVFTDEAGVVERYAVMAGDNRQFAKFNQIGFDESGKPSADDLHLAWAAGARAFEFRIGD